MKVSWCLAAAAELGYRPNLLARSLSQKRTHIIGVAIDEMKNPHSMMMLDMVTKQLQTRGYYDKCQTVAALEMETDYPPIFAEGFKLAKISEGAVLLTYKSFQRDAQGRAVRCTERSSIWLLTEKAGWQMRFHQGTPAED